MRAVPPDGSCSFSNAALDDVLNDAIHHIEVQGHRLMVYVVCDRCGNRSRLFDERSSDTYLCPVCRVASDSTNDLGSSALYICDDDPVASETSRRAPRRLRSLCHYLVCDSRNIVARWEDNGQGWMLRMTDGYARVASVEEDIPIFGEFVFVEIGIQRRLAGRCITHIHGFQLEPNLSLLKLLKGDTVILSSIVRSATPTAQQMSLVREFVQSKFLRSVWKELDE